MKRISRLGEEGLIRRVSRAVRTDRSVLRGIGDDCAALRGSGGRVRLFASDMLVEGVHFRRDARPEAVGWKALAVNVSDVAAMGGVPRHAVISLGLPKTTPVSRVDGFYRGLRRCARRFSVNLVGGDTVRAPQMVVDVAILGEAEEGRVVYRTGARPGDWLLVTGRLGGAVRSGRHLAFLPRVREARQLTARARLSAMMDLSDGLWPDLSKMCRASRVGALLEADRIPRQAGCSLAQALTDGEDFELLIAARPRQARRLLGWATPKRFPCGLRRIGRVTARRPGRTVTVVDGAGAEIPVPLKGFQHF